MIYPRTSPAAPDGAGLCPPEACTETSGAAGLPREMLCILGTKSPKFLRNFRGPAGLHQVIKTKSVREAIDIAKKRVSLKGLILVAGSLFIVGEARQILTKIPFLKISPQNKVKIV